MSDWEGQIHIGLGWAYYSGPVGDTDFHRHYAVQFCFPSSADLVIETKGQSQTIDRGLVVGSNVSHRLSHSSLDARLLYLEPCLVKENIRRLNIQNVAVLDLTTEKMATLNAILALGPSSTDTDFGQEIISLIWPVGADGTGTDDAVFSEIDPRVSSCLTQITQSVSLNLTLSQLTVGSGLSPSRFRRLFSAQVGMPLKSYLLWTKLQRAVLSLTADGSLTNAAHLGGFADSAHLARTFRKTFGFSPSELTKHSEFAEEKSTL